MKQIVVISDLEAPKLFAHHKGGGPAVNGCNPAGRHLDAEHADGQKISAGSIISCQRGTKIHPGKNVGIGGDDTLFVLASGIVKFERLDRDRKQASVYPVEEAK